MVKSLQRVKKTEEEKTLSGVKRVNKFLKEAVEEAKTGVKKKHGGPFGAVIVINGKIIAKEHNKVILGNDPTAHAEINAIRKATRARKSFDLSDCVIYSTCEPCPMCLAAIYWARIKKVYYGCTRNDAERCGFDDRHIYDAIQGSSRKKQVKMVKMPKRECVKMMKAWRERNDRVTY